MMNVIIIVVLVIFFLWLFYEAWRTPIYRENEDGTYTPLSKTKTFKDLVVYIKNLLKF